jgi:quinol monooxygenase YgiN/ketosteroid isomerase-like protein
MKNRLTIVVIALMTITLASCGDQSQEQDKTAIDKMRLDFMTAFNKSDANSLDPLIDQNAVWQIPGIPSVTGKDKIVAAYANVFTTVQSQLDLQPGEIQLSEGCAVLSGDFTRTQKLLTDQTVRYFTGKYLMALRKEGDGTWKFTRDIWNDQEVTDLSSKLPVTESKKMIVAKLSVKPEKTKSFIAAAREMIEKSNKESGCSFYQLYHDPYDPTKFVFVEEYKNQAAVDDHFSTEHFKAFGPKIADFATGPAEIKILSIASEVLK